MYKIKKNKKTNVIKNASDYLLFNLCRWWDQTWKQKYTHKVEHFMQIHVTATLSMLPNAQEINENPKFTLKIMIL